MEQLFEFQDNILSSAPNLKERYLERNIDWSNRLIAIKGARGAGKTSVLLRHILTGNRNKPDVLYTSLDHLYFSSHTLLETADSFQKRGGKLLILDEVHKYPNWSQEIKNIYDSFRNLNIVFTGSSILDILKGKADLSRRVMIYDLFGLSFREFLEFETGIPFLSYSLDDLLANHWTIATDVNLKTKPLEHFRNYLQFGYYPFYMEGINAYPSKLMNVINQTLESDLPLLKNVEIAYIPRLKKLLYLLAVSTPVQPNISKLSQLLETSRNTVQLYLEYLHDARLINLSRSAKSGYAVMAKPEKIFLQNTNLSYLLSEKKPDIGNLRETYFYNQLAVSHEVSSPSSGDFIVNGKYTFEVGGRNKKQKQIRDIQDSFIIADDIEFGLENRIPLWLLGFLY
ncbi:MAG: AAA family ATPase [Bacteroidetes bacterium]|nr:AAA family ATPase [Bacteroidota bacterium]